MHPLLIVLTVLGGLLLLLLLLLLLGHARVRIRCPGKALRVTLSVCGIPFTLLSDAEKEIPDPKDLEHPEALLRRERRRQRRAEKRAEKKRLRAREKAARRAEQKRARESSGQPTPNLKEKLEMILALLKLLYRETGGKLRLRVRRLHLLVGTDDAAKTAILYGVVLQSATYLLQWIDTHLLRIDRRDGAMTVEPDFVSGKCHADIDLTCSIRLYTALVIGIRMLLAFQREKATAMRKAALREKSKAQRKP